MTGYVPLSKRLKVSQQRSKPLSLQARLGGENRSFNNVSSLSGLNSKRKRSKWFHRSWTGVKLARSLGQSLKWLCLSTPVGYDKTRLSKDYQTLRKRIEHANPGADNFQGFHMEYVKGTTDEGNGVIHNIFKVSPRQKYLNPTLNSLPNARKRRKSQNSLPVHGQTRGYIPWQWLMDNWSEITTGKKKYINTSIKEVYGSGKGLCGYLTQYFSGQNKARHLSNTQNWVYSGYIGDWNRFKPRIAELYRSGYTNEDAEIKNAYHEWDTYILEHLANRQIGPV